MGRLDRGSGGDAVSHARYFEHARCDWCGGLMFWHDGSPRDASSDSPQARYWHDECQERETAYRAEQLEANEEWARKWREEHGRE